MSKVEAFKRKNRIAVIFSPSSDPHFSPCSCEGCGADAGLRYQVGGWKKDRKVRGRWYRSACEPFDLCADCILEEAGAKEEEDRLERSFKEAADHEGE